MKKLALFVLLIGFLSGSLFAQRKRNPVSISPRMETCDAINELAEVLVNNSGEVFFGTKQVKKNDLQKEFDRRICGKFPPDQIIYINTNSTTSMGVVNEVIKLGRKADVDKFVLRLADSKEPRNDKNEVIIRIPAEGELPSKKEKRSLRLLAVLLEIDDKIKLNNKAETSVTLTKTLQQIFSVRKRQKTYVPGTKEIDKTVFVYARENAKFGDFINLTEAISKSGASLIGLDIDNYYDWLIF
jgi:biopolymer transport protein ExbD